MGNSLDTAAQAQARLAAIVESSDDAIVSKSLDGIISSWNAAAERLFGYRPEEIIGTSILKLIPTDLRQEEVDIITKVRAGQRVEHYETVRLRKDGSTVHVSLTVSPMRDASGQIIGASKIARDISSQRDADRAKAVLAAIIQSSDDAIISKNLDGVVTSWNPAAERMYGYSAEEMVGGTIHRIIPVDLHDEEDRILTQIRAGGSIDHYETVRIHKNGRKVDVSITVSPVRDVRGNVIGASKIARDVTAQREAQRKKDQFLAVLAHELRNPLAPIRAAISLFGQPQVSAAQRDRAQTIAERQIQHMAHLLDDLLDVSRMSTGRVELKRADVELSGLVRQAVDATRALMESRGHNVRIDELREPVWLHADSVRISQIFTNLLTNAAKYTDPGGQIALTVVHEGNEVVVSVKDNGIGFSLEMKERLFTLFSQDDEARERAAGGLGIGLALVREFVERHGGSVEARSEGRGRGAEFVVRLPLIAPPEAVATPSAAATAER